MGIGPLIASRVGGLIAAVMIFTTLVAGFVLAPFMIVGGWRRRRSVDFGPFFAYAAILFGFSALVSAVHVPGGTFIHSAIALAPYAYILALEGIVAGVVWIARRRPSWDADQASRIFVGAAVGFALVLTVTGSLLVHANWAGRQVRFETVAGALQRAGAAGTDRVMSIDASGTKYWTGHGGVVLVNDPLETIEEVARAYDIRWLVLDRSDSVAAVEPILDGQRPAWVGAPVMTQGDPVRLAVYPLDLAAS